MTALTHDLEHAARGVERLIERYRKPRTSALLASWLDEVQEVEDALWQLLVERWLSSAEGDQLDVLGAIVGQPRQGRDDETYRLWISVRNLVMRSSGKTSEMLTIARKLVAVTDTIKLEEYYPAAMVFRLTGDFTLDDGYQIAYMLRQAKAAGVLFQMTWSVVDGGDTFTFSPDDSPVLSSSMGFDEGAFAVVGDGSFIPPEPPPLPLGTLTIDGVPLVIDGVPLVITPPAPLAWAPTRPLIAKGVRIVPVVAPRAGLAPVPLAGETIELEDAFSDASLEMDAEGDQFRVAAALQAAVADNATDIIAHAVAIDALANSVDDITDALRFTASLRTQSVAETTYEEIGVLRFDATPYAGAVTFVAELEVAIAGQTVDLQLYDLTAAAAVHVLSTGATTTTKVTAALSLPSAEHLYSLRLRRVGGDSTQRVSCRSAAFEVT